MNRYYWKFRYEDTRDIAVVIRTFHRLTDETMGHMLQAFKDRGTIEDRLLLIDREDGYLRMWDMAISFDLCPCIEIYYASHRDPMLRWKTVTV